MKEYYYDKLLNVRTTGKSNSGRVDYYHPYEPTPYVALEELLSSYPLSQNDRIVDFGCGKGRLNFFLHYFHHISVVGIDFNEQFYKQAIENRKQYAIKTKNKVEKVEFKRCLAEEYKITSRDNLFYFFNPFSIHIFIRVVNNILNSVEENIREVDLILYYPSEDYIFYLENNTSFQLTKEIKVPDLYTRDSSERFLIYRLTTLSPAN